MILLIWTFTGCFGGLTGEPLDDNPLPSEGLTNCIPEPEVCDDVDNNCDGIVDEEGAEGATAFYADGDGDGIGGPTPRLFCAPPTGFVVATGDCDDANPDIFPNAPEVCNAVDDDCNGQPDDGLSFENYYPDNDGDGWGAIATPTVACEPQPGAVLTTGDCDDFDRDRFPGAPEICDDFDNDCNNLVDDGTEASIGGVAYRTLQTATVQATNGQTIAVCSGAPRFLGVVLDGKALTLKGIGQVNIEVAPSTGFLLTNGAAITLEHLSLHPDLSGTTTLVDATNSDVEFDDVVANGFSFDVVAVESNVTLTDTILDGGRAAIRFEGGADLTVERGEIRNHTGAISGQGPVIWVRDDPSGVPNVDFLGAVEIWNNEAPDGVVTFHSSENNNMFVVFEANVHDNEAGASNSPLSIEWVWLTGPFRSVDGRSGRGANLSATRARVENFTLEGGVATSSTSGGGGAYVDGSVLVDGVIRGNEATLGGGVFIAGDQRSDFENVAVTQNTAEDGGGFYLGLGSWVLLDDRTDCHNNTSLGLGGCMYANFARLQSSADWGTEGAGTNNTIAELVGGTRSVSDVIGNQSVSFDERP